MIQEHKMNIPVSREVYKTCKEWIQPKQCYNNIFNVLSHGYGRFFHTNQWRVAYGYVTAVEPYMARHCFIVDENGCAIDPTALTLKYFDEQNPKQYLSFKLFDFDEYLKMLNQHNLEPSLLKALIEEEKTAREWAEKKNVIFLG